MVKLQKLKEPSHTKKSPTAHLNIWLCKKISIIFYTHANIYFTATVSKECHKDMRLIEVAVNNSKQTRRYTIIYHQQ